MTGPNPAPEPWPDGLLCAVALDPQSVPRNRFYWVYAEPRARRAHARAHALRRLYRQLVPMLRDGKPIGAVEQDRGLRIVYRDEPLSLVRTLHLGALEASLLRLLLRPLPDVPACLREVDGDRRRVMAALSNVRGHPGLPPASEWLDALMRSQANAEPERE